MILEEYPNYQSFKIANSIFKTVEQSLIHLDTFKRGSTASWPVLLSALEKIKLQMDELYMIISKNIEIDQNDFVLAFQLTKQFSKFKKEAELGIILAYTYVMITAIENETKYQLIADAKHTIFARSLMSEYQHLFGEYLQNRTS